MNKLFPLLAAALAIEALQMTDGACTLTEAQCSTLEDFLKAQADKLQATVTEKDGIIAQRDQTIAELQKKPADTTAQVINNATADPAVEYGKVLDEARDMFNAIP